MNKQPPLIRDTHGFGPPPPRPRETLWEKLYRFFFGDDIFISYARSDAIRYVPSLAARLAAQKYICFFDQLVADPNEDLPETLKKKILRSTVFVLIGTKGAVSSSFVRKEIELFRRTRRPFIPVDVDGAVVDQQNWRDVIGLAKIHEEGARVRAGDPSPEVVNLIRDSFGYTRRSQWLRASLLAGVGVICMTLLISLLVIWIAKAEAATIKRLADSDVTAANQKVSDAEQRLQGIAAEGNRLKREAADARDDASQASARQKMAEQSRQQAEAAEREAAERAAETSRREAGSRSTVLSREPGSELDALALAVKAAEQSFAHGNEKVPSEVMDGITQSVMAADYSLPLEDVGTNGVATVLISPNGERILGKFENTRGESTRLVLWQSSSGKIVSDILIPGLVWSASFSRDSRRLATLSVIGPQLKLDVWDLTVRHLSQIETTCSAKRDYGDVALDSDGTHVMVGAIRQPDWFMNITVCEIATGREETLNGMFGAQRVAFTPEDEPAVYGSSADSSGTSRMVFVFFPRSDRRVVLRSPGEGIADDFAGFGDDGSIITMIRDRTARGQDRVYVQSPDGSVRRFGGYRGTVSSATFVDGEAQVVTVSGRVMRLADRRKVPNFAALRAHVRPLDLVAFSPNGKTVLTMGDDGKGRLWDVQTGHLRQTLAITDELLYEGRTGLYRPKTAAFQAGGKLLVTANDKGEIHTWDTDTGRSICSVVDRRYFLAGVSFLIGGDYLMAAYSRPPTEGATVDFLEARTCKLVGTLNLDEKINSFSFAEDGSSIITGVSAEPYHWLGYRSELKLWDLRGIVLTSGTPIRLSSSIIARPPGRLIKYLFDGTRMLTLTQDEAGSLWVSGRNSPVRLEARRGDPSPFLVKFSADGTRVADVSRKVRVWDTRSGKLLVCFEASGAIDSSIPFSLSPDGSKLVMANSDYTVRIYPTSQTDFLNVARRLLGR